ncbi:sensor histidine kinase [Streptomyces sp. NBC_00079]|uniref:sensor histidine kinase n=1 Tax=Streptomyces sp. NBC_00079 TaxID=2975644 RepID=UPI003244B262
MDEELPLPLLGRMRVVHWVALDFLLAAVVLAVSVDGAVGRTPAFGAPPWLAFAAASAAAAPLAVRRRSPLAGFALVLGGNTVVTVLGVSGNPAIPVALTLYTLALTRPSRGSAAAFAAGLSITLAADVVWLAAEHPALEGQTAIELTLASTAVIAAGWALGVARRSQRRYAAHAAEQRVRSAVTDERLRIARELHDVIAHSMSLITVKAAVTNYLLDSQPEQARAALAVIEASGHNALAEMRRMLGVLRADNEPYSPPGGTVASPEPPAPCLDDLPQLAARAAEAGVHVDVQVHDAAGLPEGVALSAYRIVQEALTNVIKHAAPTRCRVRIEATDAALNLDVTDDGQAKRAASWGAPGHGIIGMRERVALFGGDFYAGPVADGGFRVSARLPLTPSGTTAPPERNTA